MPHIPTWVRGIGVGFGLMLAFGPEYFSDRPWIAAACFWSGFSLVVIFLFWGMIDRILAILGPPVRRPRVDVGLLVISALLAIASVSAGVAGYRYIWPNATVERIAKENPSVAYNYYDNRSYITYGSEQQKARTFIKFRPSGDEIIDAGNIASVSDNGSGDFTFTFAKPLDPNTLSVQPLEMGPARSRSQM